MVIRIAIALIAGFLPQAAAQNSRVWYVDCLAGNNNGDGLTPSTAWRSIDTVNGHTFRPGDSILFRRGSVCESMFAPKGSGTALAPIRLDAWGSGAPPQIHARPGQEAAFKLFDQEYWTIAHLEFSGGQPYGIFISGSEGILHGIRLRDLVVHNVTGKPKNKETGLVVIAAGTVHQHFDDLIIDGVTAYHTSEWAGILVGGVAHGFQPESSRNTNVIIRNCTVHDVAGDGIVLFQVNKGLIENSVAWLTGMQDTQTIGTPNAIWTWMCRDCIVRHNEAFLTDSPGVDGGAFDIDYGNANNIVEENYGHDTQGYCFAVFAAGWITTNSTVRNNVCVANGLSPRLARLQGAVFLSTWNGGKIEGLTITGNRIFWNPRIATAPLVNTADFIGTGHFEKNTIYSCSPELFRSDPSLLLRDNSFQPCNPAVPHSEQNWCLTAFISADEQDPESRGQIALLESVRREYPKLKIRTVVADASAARTPALLLTDTSGSSVWQHEGLMPPGELGLALRSRFGAPQFAELPANK